MEAGHTKYLIFIDRKQVLIMKRFISLILAATLLLALAACGSTASSQPTSVPASPSVPESSSSTAPESSSALESSSVSAPESSAAAQSSSALESSSTSAAVSSTAASSTAASQPAASSSQAASSKASQAAASSSPSSDVSSSKPDSSDASSSQAAEATEGIGAVMLLPNDDANSVTPMGLDQLMVLIPRAGVEPGDTTLTVYDTRSGEEYCSVDLDDKGVVEYLDWSSYNGGFFESSEGTALLINLDTELKADRNYHILAEEGWLTIPELNINSKGIDSKNTWVIRVGDFGIEFDSENNEVSVGATVAIPCTLGAANRLEVTASPKKSVTIKDNKFTSDGDALLTFEERGNITVTFTFFDGSGNELTGIEQLFKCR